MFENLVVKTLSTIASNLVLFTKKQVYVQYKRNKNATILINLLASI